MEHDYCYAYEANSEQDCDDNMLRSLSKHKGETLAEKAVKGLLVRPVIYAKRKANLNLY